MWRILKVYMETYKPDYVIKLSAKNFGYVKARKILKISSWLCADRGKKLGINVPPFLDTIH